MADYSAEGKTPEVLFWVGCAGSFDARAQKVTKAFVKILMQLKLILLSLEMRRAALVIQQEERVMSLCFR